MPTPVVIDLYHGDTVASFSEIKDSGIVAVIHKASEGLHYRDSKYRNRRQAFTDMGFKWGAYHFFRGNPTAEADYFYGAAEPDENTVMALDWEDTPGGQPSADSARKFIERLEYKLGRQAVIYSGNVAKEQIRGKNPFFGARRLWLAQYSSHWKVQQSWKEPWLWQYGSEITHSRVPGVIGYCDVNAIVSGTVEEFVASWVPKASV